MSTISRKEKTKVLVLSAVLTALVVVLQLLGSFIKLGPFSISLVLIPIVLGAATCGKGVGAWLGLTFGVTVLLSGDAAAFMSISVIGTIVTVLAKGLLCGFAAGVTYRIFAKKNQYIAVLLAAFVCPVVNTGVFLLGCVCFFLKTVSEWGAAEGFSNVIGYMFLGLAGGNFLFELATNLILSPTILRVINYKDK